jgi:hypothetical protein
MSKIRLRLATGALAAVLALPLVAACQSGGSSSGPHAGASAAASLAGSPQMVRDETNSLKDLSRCTARGTGGELTFAVVPGKGSASIPGTAQPPTAQLSHVSFLLLHGFRTKMQAVLDCAAPPASRAQAEACAKHLSLPTSKAAVSGYLVKLAGCLPETSGGSK